MFQAHRGCQCQPVLGLTQLRPCLEVAGVQCLYPDPGSLLSYLCLAELGLDLDG